MIAIVYVDASSSSSLCTSSYSFRYILQTVLLRSKTRQKHTRHNQTNRHSRQHNHDEETQLKTKEQSPAHPPPQPPQFPVPRQRPQSSSHRRNHHGRVPHLLGPVLLHQHRGGLLQNLHTGHNLQDPHVAGVLKLRVQPHHLLYLQHRVSGGVQADPDDALSLVVQVRIPVCVAEHQRQVHHGLRHQNRDRG